MKRGGWASLQALLDDPDVVLKEDDGCWVWMRTAAAAAGNCPGYGMVHRKPDGRWGLGSKTGLEGHYMHRAIAALGGPLPKGAEVQHTCGLSLCVRPDHLVVRTDGKRPRVAVP